jgi:hypothetical protein
MSVSRGNRFLLWADRVNPETETALPVERSLNHGRRAAGKSASWVVHALKRSPREKPLDDLTVMVLKVGVEQER